MRILIFTIVSCLTFISYSQEKFSEKPEDYKITDENLAKVFSDAWTEEYKFVAETNTTISESDTSYSEMTKFSYDPHLKLGQRWKFVAKEGVDASRGDLEIFLNTSHKEAVKSNKFEVAGLIKRKYVKFDSVGTDYIVFSFQIPENKLPEPYKFVQYIKGYILIKKSTQKFEKIALEITHPCQGINYFMNDAKAEYFYEYDKENDRVILLKHIMTIDIKEEDGYTYRLEQVDTYTDQAYVGLTDKQNKKNKKKNKN